MSAVTKPEQLIAVILVREAHPRAVEVLLTRRPDELPVIGGKYGFPAGAVHKSDHAANLLRRCRGLSGEAARKILGAHFSPREALGFWIAAVRTLFEEVGILIAVNENGEPLAWAAELRVQLLKKRAALRDGFLTFQSILESENLFCDAAKFAYFCHWQTPVAPSSSADTRFFLAAVPDNHASLAAASEINTSSWLAPDRALQLFNRGELSMAFPTFASLRTLADFGSVNSLLTEFQPKLT